MSGRRVKKPVAPKSVKKTVAPKSVRGVKKTVVTSSVSGLQKPINSLDLENFADVHDLVVVEYDKLPLFNSIEELFNDKVHVVLFYSSDYADVGHFVLLSHIGTKPATEKEEKTYVLEYFDPTGLLPDEACEKLNQSKKLKNRKYLMEFCGRVGNVDLDWNNMKLQGDTMVCGKWCILRALSISTPFKDFVEIFESSELVPDVICDRLIRVKRSELSQL